LSKRLVNTAETLSSGALTTEREIALWVEHLGPVWKQSDRQMKQALVDWYEAMQAEGLKDAGANKMERFARGSLGN